MRISNLVFALATLASGPGLAQTTGKATSESRNAALAYIGTQNFVVGRVGSECLQMLGRTESPKVFAGVWQERNLKYIAASDKYMQAMLQEAEQSGGKQLQELAMRQLQGIVRTNGEKIVSMVLDHPDRKAACARIVGIMDRGVFDFSETTPIFKELVALVEWAKD
jgi:hypothetical protein